MSHAQREGRAAGYEQQIEGMLGMLHVAFELIRKMLCTLVQVARDRRIRWQIIQLRQRLAGKLCSDAADHEIQNSAVGCMRSGNPPFLAAPEVELSGEHQFLHGCDAA